VNHAQIYGDIKGSIDAYHTSQWFTFGEDIGDAAAKVLIGNQAMKLKDMSTAKQIAAGFLKGAADAENFVEIEQCAGDFEQVGEHLLNAVHDFEKKTIPDSIVALKEIGFAMDALMTTIGPCSQVKPEMDKLKEAAARFTNPKELIAHTFEDITVNGLKIINEIRAAVDDSTKGDMYDMGYQLGEMVA